MHRDLEPRFHPVQCRSGRHLPRSSRQARRHRDGFRAGLLDHPEHQALHRLLEEGLELQHRCLPADLRSTGGHEQAHLLRHLPGTRPDRALRRSQTRHRLPRHRRPHPHPQLLDRRRHPARQHRAQLRAAPHPAPGGPLRAGPRLHRRKALSSGPGRHPRARNGRRLPGIAGAGPGHQGHPPPRGEQLQRNPRPRAPDVRGRGGCALGAGLPGRGRLQAL